MNQVTNLNGFTGLRRGDRVNGGRFVGQEPQGRIWVCHDQGELAFRRMCAQFDALFSPRPRFAAVA